MMSSALGALTVKKAGSDEEKREFRVDEKRRGGRLIL
jgi:hypothetical protein